MAKLLYIGAIDYISSFTTITKRSYVGYGILQKAQKLRKKDLWSQVLQKEALLMVAPVIVVAGAMAGSSILNYVLNQKTTRAQIRQSDYVADYSRRYNAENRRYWADYYKNTGFRPRYPMRSGAEYNLSALYGARTSRANAIASQYRAGAGVGVSGAYGLNAIYRKR